MTEYRFYITACGKQDGFGSQTLSKILAYIFCEYYNYIYVHTKLNNIEVKHKNIIQDKIGHQEYLNGNTKKWNDNWEYLINLSSNYVENYKYDLEVDLTDVLKSGQISMNNNYLWHNFDPNKIIQNYKIDKYKNIKILFKVKEFPKIDTYESLFIDKCINKLRILYNPINTNLLFNKESFNIVVHKRMSGPYKYTNNTNLNNKNCRVTLNTYFINLFKKLYLKYKSENPIFWIFSDGELDDFKELKVINYANHNNIIKTNIITDTEENNKYNFDINLLLQYNSQLTFQHFVKADILILDKSSFGYVAGLYNENTVIYNSYWDTKKHDWVVASEI